MDQLRTQVDSNAVPQSHCTKPLRL